MLYTLIGGGGAVGKELVPVLKKRGHDVRVLGRDKTKLQKVYEVGVDCREADINNADQLETALKGTDIIIYLVGVAYNQFELHPKLMKEALAACKATKVPYFLHVSTVYPYGLPQMPTVDENHPRDPNTFKGRMRKEQENVVLEAERSDGPKCIIMRPSDFYGPTAENSMVRDIFLAALNNRRANVIAPVDTPHDFIYLPDLARAIVELSEQPSAYGEAYNITGPEPLTTQAFADAVFSEAGLPTALLKAGPLMLKALGWFNPVLGEVVEMHYLWTTPVLLDDTKLKSRLPNFEKTPHTEAIKQTLAKMRDLAPTYNYAN